MKKLLSITLTLCLLIGAAAAQAGQMPFRDDVAAINQAADSVLMLLVYDGNKGSYAATGSGFVAFDSRTLITNYHVIKDGDLILAESDSGQSYFLDEVIAADEARDLAILRFKADTKLQPLPLQQEDTLLRGQPVVAIGSPEGYKNSVSKGDISALFIKNNMRHIQFTAPISPGSSGGALFDNEGMVIGVTTSFLDGSSQNINFAIDIKEAIALYEAAANQAPYPLAQLKKEQQQTAQTTADAAASIKNLTARQTGPGSVMLTWDSDLPEGTTYHVAHQVKGNIYYYFFETQAHSITFDSLIIPGEQYEFAIALSEEGLEDPLLYTELKLEDAAPLAMRDAHVLSLGLYYSYEQQPYHSYLPKAMTRFGQEDMARAMDQMGLCLAYRVRLAEAEAASQGTALYTLRTPDGFYYVIDYEYDFPASENGYLRYADLRELLGDVVKFEGEITTGTYTAAIYLDSALVGSVDFEVTEEAQIKPEDVPPLLLVKDLPLVIGEEAYVGDHPTPYINPDVQNAGKDLAVTGFTLVYFGEDKGFYRLPFGDSGQELTYFSYDTRIAPGELINPGKVSLKQYGPSLYKVYVAISDIRLEDGSVITIPMPMYEFISWEIE
jgi:hypothetical protein